MKMISAKRCAEIIEVLSVLCADVVVQNARGSKLKWLEVPTQSRKK